jgi:hypothetical protein
MSTQSPSRARRGTHWNVRGTHWNARGTSWNLVGPIA